jgi:hypothetical protein
MIFTSNKLKLYTQSNSAETFTLLLPICSLKYTLIVLKATYWISTQNIKRLIFKRMFVLINIWQVRCKLCSFFFFLRRPYLFDCRNTCWSSHKMHKVVQFWPKLKFVIKYSKSPKYHISWTSVCLAFLAFLYEDRLTDKHDRTIYYRVSWWPNIRVETCREYQGYIIKCYVNCCEQEGIIYSLTAELIKHIFAALHWKYTLPKFAIPTLLLLILLVFSNMCNKK